MAVSEEQNLMAVYMVQEEIEAASAHVLVHIWRRFKYTDE
jgi:hypothetical protein